MEATYALLWLAAAFWTAGEPVERHLPLSREVSKKVTDRFGNRFVTVQVWLQKSQGEEPTRSRWVRDEYEEKRPLHIAGLAVDSRTIWMPDLDMERRFIARVAVQVSQDGEPLPAALLGTFLQTPGWMVKTEKPIPGVEPLEFVSWEHGPENLITLGATFGRGGPILTTSGGPRKYWHMGESSWTQVSIGVLLIDRELRPVGYTFSGYLGLEKAPDIWRGQEIAAGPILEFEAFDRMKELITQKAASWILTVRGFFRREEDLDDRQSRRFSPSYRRRNEFRNEFLASGYLVSPQRVLVNFGLERENAMRLERIIIHAGERKHPARFLGAFRHFRAFLVELEETTLPHPMDLSRKKPFELSQPLIAVAADLLTGRRRDHVNLNRITDFVQAYRGVVEPALQHFPRPGTLLLSVEDHSLLGVVLEVTRESDEGYRRSYSSSSGIDLRVLLPGELQEILDRSEFDSRLRPRPMEREKDMVWLGVDYQPITRELARSHQVEIATRGGEIGIIVLNVHKGSPAETIGLAVGDILLSLREEDEPEPFELSARSEYSREGAYLEMIEEDMPEDLQMEWLANAGPPWRSPRNFLNEKLTRIGEGCKVEFTYLRGGRESKVWLELTTAPQDFESSGKYKAEELGLTVKNLTYEVRSYYRLPEDAPGVVVAKVEPGSKAAIARVLPFEILVSVNGRFVRKIDDFRQILEETSKTRDTDRMLELKLERMGKSRILRILY